jgi:ParB family chromosome partitioning protein
MKGIDHMAARKGLGKGLDSMIPDKVGSKAAKVEKAEKPTSEHAADAVMMDISKVEPNRDQPRKKFDEDALLELAESIKQFGVLQPLLVQERDEYYEIIAGERRWRAAMMANVKEIPVIIKKLSEQEIMEISLIENIQREDLNPIEEAQAYKRLLTEFHLKQDEVAERVSKSRTAVTNAMRLLKLNDKVQQMVIDEMLSTGHARALLGIEDQEKQYSIAQKIFDEKLSVRDTEKLVKSLQNENKKEPKEPEKLDPKLEAIYRDLEEQMKNILGTKVTINHKDAKKGKLEIEYYSQDELDRIIDLLRSVVK